jgi:periplasmic protein TonB
VRSAVQAAMQYPYAARMARIQGKTQVSFDFLNGKASHLRVLVSSGYGVLDQAALKAVNAAIYPPPPQELAGKTLTLEVWVKFQGTIN